MTALTHPFLTNFQVSGRQRKRPLLSRLAGTIRRWRRRVAERDILATMTIPELHDLGISTADRFQELSKPFWRG